MMDMIRVIDWWPRVYTSQPKIKSKAAIRGRSTENVGGGCGDDEQKLEILAGGTAQPWGYLYRLH
jgi:hypothetical protein